MLWHKSLITAPDTGSRALIETQNLFWNKYYHQKPKKKNDFHVITPCLSTVASLTVPIFLFARLKKWIMRFYKSNFIKLYRFLFSFEGRVPSLSIYFRFFVVCFLFARSPFPFYFLLILCFFRPLSVAFFHLHIPKPFRYRFGMLVSIFSLVFLAGRWIFNLLD